MTSKPETKTMFERIASLWINDGEYAGTPSHRGEGETDAEYRLAAGGAGDFLIRFNTFEGWELARYEADEIRLPPFAWGTLAEMAEYAEGIVQDAVTAVFDIFAPRPAWKPPQWSADPAKATDNYGDFNLDIPGVGTFWLEFDEDSGWQVMFKSDVVRQFYITNEPDPFVYVGEPVSSIVDAKAIAEREYARITDALLKNVIVSTP